MSSTLISAYTIALASATIAGTGLAIWLWFRAKGQTGMRPLAYFSFGVSIWCLAFWIIQQTAPAPNIGLYLLAFSLLNPTFFLHFSVHFVHGSQSVLTRSLINLLYFCSFTLTALTFIYPLGTPELTSHGLWQLQLSRWGWFIMVVASVISLIGYVILYKALKSHIGEKKYSQILAVMLSGALGFACIPTFLWHSVGIDWFPYPVLLFPLYNLALVFGIQRYEVMNENHWASRAIAWAVLIVAIPMLVALLLAAITHSGITQYTNISIIELWLIGIVLALLFELIRRPLYQVVDRLIYPGIHLQADTLNQWQQQLTQSESMAVLSHRASELLKEHLQQNIPIIIDSDEIKQTTSPYIHCEQSEGVWQCRCIHWEGASKNQQKLGQWFASTLTSSIIQLEQTHLLIAKTKQEIETQHFVEMGQLSAAVAHDLRNPLNIVAMASTACPELTQQDIQKQLTRADHLIQDLLHYTSELTINAQPIQAHYLIQQCINSFPEQQQKITLNCHTDCILQVDSFRWQQVMNNLISNALNAISHVNDGQVTITVNCKDAVKIEIRDNGLGIPEDIQQTLFKPFTSRRHGGIGLGLAIVKRIIDAHHGHICVQNDPNWSTAFSITLPLENRV